MVAVTGSNVSGLTLDGLRIRTPQEATVLGVNVYTISLSHAQNITITNNQITAGDALAGSGGQFGSNGVQGRPGDVGANAVCTAAPTGGSGGAAGQPGPPSAGSQLGVTGGEGGDGGSQNVSGENGIHRKPSGSITGGTVGPVGQAHRRRVRRALTAPTGCQVRTVPAVNRLGRCRARATCRLMESTGHPEHRGAAAVEQAAAPERRAVLVVAVEAAARAEVAVISVRAGKAVLGRSGYSLCPRRESPSTTTRSVTGRGGAGGSGGVGGNGTPGRPRGLGGNGCGGGGNGGRGGNGGSGGSGGHGGGGGGGPSIGIIHNAASTVTIGPNNTFQIGQPGGGGFSQGSQGSSGIAGNAVYF